MKTWIPLLTLSLAALAAATVSSGGAAPAPGSAPRSAPRSDGPVVVELFTSQGCSSCPPADRLLSRLSEDPALAGRVVPLSFHVDYWNYIGWQDPFSSERWSDRQKRYARAFGSSRIYTPQLVVNGASECVGSDEQEVRRRISQALAVSSAGPAGRIALALAPAADAVKVKVDARLDGARAPRDLEVWVALWETGLTTPVGSGENARHTLRNDYVVRRFERAFILPAAGTPRSGELTLKLDPAWKRANLGVAAFLQDPSSLQIAGAASRRLG
jgi:hypothetical protein